MKCSIIVANYNNGKYLPELINSVSKQTYSNWELVITDDCSSDNSVEIINQYISDQRIKLIKHDKNKGVSAAFQSSVDNSSGEIVIMLGADDGLTKTAVEKVVLLHKKYENCSMIMGQKVFCDTNLNRTKTAIGFPKIQTNDTYLKHFGLVGFDTFKKWAYEKSAGFDTEQKKAADQALYFAMEEVAPIISVELKEYLYRTNPNGISQQNNKSYAHEFNYLAIIKAYKRRKKTGFKNISEKKYNEVLRNYHYLKFVNDYKRGLIDNLNEQEKLILEKLSQGKKAQTINELCTVFKLLENTKISEKKYVKQKIIQSYFIKEQYNFDVLKDLFNTKIWAVKYLPFKVSIRIIIKSIFKWKVKK
jgi:glycosyltransferase involved in cell wall biosynthesis